MFSQNVGAMYDSWLLQKADEYMSSGCGGEPQVISAEKEFEGYDEDGCIEYSMSYTYSCEDCREIDCEHWRDFHEDEWEEIQAEREEEDAEN